MPGLRAEAPWLDAATARQHARAAALAETSDVSAESLLALAYRESRYDESARPMCGVTQVTLHGRACARLRAAGLTAQYAAGAAAIGRWSALCHRLRRAKGVSVLRCSLNGFAEGVVAAKRGWGVKGCGGRRCDRSLSVLARARRISGWAEPRQQNDS